MSKKIKQVKPKEDSIFPQANVNFKNGSFVDMDEQQIDDDRNFVVGMNVRDLFAENEFGSFF